MRVLVNQTSRFFYNRSLGLLLIRVAVGLIFLLHGFMKVESLSMVTALMAHFGFFPWVGYFIAWLELLGGLALILGVATRFFGFLLGIEMLVAVFLIGFARGLGIEFLLSLVCFGIALAGSGRYSIYKMECSHCGGMLCNTKDGTCMPVAAL